MPTRSKIAVAGCTILPTPYQELGVVANRGFNLGLML